MAERRKLKTFVIQNGYRRSQIIEFQEAFNLTMIGSPSGIRFNVAGNQFNDGEVLQLENGDYPYTAFVPGNSLYETRTGIVNISGADAVLNVSLAQASKITTIKTTNNAGTPLDGVRVVVNNEVLGTTNSEGDLTINLATGRQVIVLDKELYTFAPVETDFDGGTVIFKLYPITDPSKGHMSIIPSEPGASIYINKELVPESPFSALLPAGVYPITVKKEGYRDFSSSVTVVAGKNNYIYARMQVYSPTGTVTFTSGGVEALITLDGKVFGNTPKTLVRPAGLYKWTVTKEGYIGDASEVVINEGLNSVVEARLVKEPNPPEGTILEEFVQIGNDWYQTIADGNGGRISVLKEKNSPRAGFPTTRKVTVFFNVPATIDITSGDGYSVLTNQKTTRLNSIVSTKKNSATFELKTGKAYIFKSRFDVERAVPQELESGPYIDSEIDFDFSDTNDVTPVEKTISLYPYAKRRFVAIYELTMNENDLSPYITTNGTGFISYNASTKAIEASATLAEYVGTREDTRGNLTLTVMDEAGNTVSTKSLTHGAVAMYTNLTYSLPRNAVGVVFDLAGATRGFQDNTSKGVSEITWTGDSSFKYTCKGWQGASAFIPGSVRVKLAIPFSYRTE